VSALLAYIDSLPWYQGVFVTTLLVGFVWNVVRPWVKLGDALDAHAKKAAYELDQRKKWDKA